jgi:hypothetical protein
VTVFAVAKLVVINDLWEIDEVDPRLLETCQRSKGPKKSFLLWVTMSNVPQELDTILLLVKYPHFKR